MKLALLSDIHANLQAFEACLAHARGEGAGQFALLGDLVGYGADPSAVLERIMQLQAQGAIVVQGNHDVAAVSPPAQAERQGDQTSAWTHGRLSAAQRQFLAGLPLEATWHGCLLVHASAHEPASWRYVTDMRSALESLEAATSRHPRIRYVFGGHVHHQTLYYQGAGRHLMPFAPTAGVPIPVPTHRTWIATIGSVGQPRDGNPAAMYALLDLAQHRLTFHRVPYDHHAAATAVLQAGLPASLAARLEQGR